MPKKQCFSYQKITPKQNRILSDFDTLAVRFCTKNFSRTQ